MCDASRLELACLTTQYRTLVSQHPTSENHTRKTVLVYGSNHKRFSIYFCIDKVFLLEWMEVCVNHMISIFKTTVLTRTQSFLVHISVQSVSDSLFLTEKVQKPIVSL